MQVCAPNSPLAFKFGDPLKGLLSQGGGVLRNRAFADPFDVWHSAIERLDELPQVTEPRANLFRRQLLFSHGVCGTLLFARRQRLTTRGEKHIMDPTELQAKATIAAALIMAHAVEVPALPTGSRRASGRDDAAARLRDLVDYVYQAIVAVRA